MDTDGHALAVSGQRAGASASGAANVSFPAPPFTGGRTRSATPPLEAGAAAAEDPAEALRGVLLSQMLHNLGVAGDAAAKATVAKEVSAFMAGAGSMRADDLAHLEGTIRARLAGEEPVRSSLASLKRAQQAGDEWARIYAFRVKEGEETDARRRREAAARAEALKQELTAQVAHRAAQQEAERREAAEYATKEQEELRTWEQEEARKRERQKGVMERLKADREVQLAERNTRKRLAAEKREAEEQELAARLAYEAKSEAEREEEERQRSKNALKAFLLNNEVLKAIKAQAKEAEWAADKKVMQQYAEQQERHEAARRAQVEKLKAWQAAQEREAAARPEAKRWIDPALVERYAQEAEAAAAAEDDRRKAAVKASTRLLAASLDDQIKQRETLRHAHDGEEEAAVRALRDGVAAEQARRAAEMAAGAAKRAELRATLEEQMKLNAARRVVAPMSDTEKMINRELLERVQQAGLATTTATVVRTKAAAAAAQRQQQAKG